MVVITGEWFGEKIGDVVSRRNLLEDDRFGLDQFTKVMVADVDMLNLSMVLRSLRESDRPSLSPLV